MKLADITDELVVKEDKITRYLLDTGHTDGGREKANFFIRFGFTVKNWTILHDALIAHGKTHDITSSSQTVFGEKFVVDGSITTPDNRKPVVRTIWQIDKNDNKARLVSAYKGKEV